MTARHTVVVRRVLGALPEAVFDEWLDPEAMAEWMCPPPARCLGVEIDTRIGGRFRIGIEEDGIRFAVTGRYEELHRPDRLRFTWTCTNWSEPTHRSIVTVTFESRGAAETTMTIRHELLPPGLGPRHERGWVAIAKQLSDAVRTRTAPGTSRPARGGR